MKLFHSMLLHFVVIISPIFLYSHNAFCSLTVNVDSELTSTKTHHNQYGNKFLSTKADFQIEGCVFDTKNSNVLENIFITSRYNELDDYIHCAMDHHPSCIIPHKIDGIVAIFRAAYLRKNNDAIDKLADKMVRNEISMPCGRWKVALLWSLCAALSHSSGTNIDAVRDMIADHIVNENTNLSVLCVESLERLANGLIKGNSFKIQEAIQKIAGHISLISVNNFQKMKCEIVSLLAGFLLKIGREGEVGFRRIADAMIAQDFTLWDGESISRILTVFRKKNEETIISGISNNPYEIVTQRIVDDLARKNTEISKWYSQSISLVIKELYLLPNSISVDDAMTKFISFVANNNLSSWSDADLSKAAGLFSYKGASRLEIKAAKNIASYLHEGVTDFANWNVYYLMDIVSALSPLKGCRALYAIQNVIDFIINAEPNEWSIHELMVISEGLNKISGEKKHYALEHIAKEIHTRSVVLDYSDRIRLAVSLSRSGGYYCRNFINDFAKDVNAENFQLSKFSVGNMTWLVKAFSYDNRECENENENENDNENKNYNDHVKDAVIKIADYFIDNIVCVDRYMSGWDSRDVSIVIGELIRNARMFESNNIRNKICHFIENQKIDLSDWAVTDLMVLLKSLRINSLSSETQGVLGRIFAVLNNPNVNIKDWTVEFLADVADKVYHLRDYSSEAFVVKVAKVYMKNKGFYKDDYHGESGIIILRSFCHFPLLSNKSVKKAIDLASMLYNRYYKVMSKESKLTLYWCITLLNFATHEKDREFCSEGKDVISKVLELAGHIPIISHSEIYTHRDTTSFWQSNFINIMNYGMTKGRDNIIDRKYPLNVKSELSIHLCDIIKKEINSDARVYVGCSVGMYPIDVFIMSGDKKLCVEIDGTNQYFKDDDKEFYRTLKERFIDFVIIKRLGCKLIRIDWKDVGVPEDRNKTIRHIKDFLSAENQK